MPEIKPDIGLISHTSASKMPNIVFDIHLMSDGSAEVGPVIVSAWWGTTPWNTQGREL